MAGTVTAQLPTISFPMAAATLRLTSCWMESAPPVQNRIAYLFGQGAFAKGVAPLSGTPLQGGFGTEGVELARVPLDSDSVLINRRRYILHPRGVKFTSASVAGDSPTAAELETAANWVRVWENKNVRLVAITHNN